jgi:DNA-binding CsgD family transcriptional regulator
VETLERTQPGASDQLPVLVYEHHAYLLAALGRGEFEDAYRYAASISPPGVLFPREQPAVWVTLDLVEAAVRTGRTEDAEAHVRALSETNIAASSARFGLLVGAAAALVATDDRAHRLFTDALAIPGVDGWPFDCARVQLLFGERLRRARATAESRVHLTAAYETFRASGAQPWMTRAAIELRAAGQGTSRRDGPGSPTLTAQEREIALLAAAGLTNKEIAAQLYLSHRTVGAHLYRVFPKLGITTRAALRDALEGSRVRS